MNIVICGYGKMGKEIESVLKQQNIICSGATENIHEFDKKIAKESICIDFTTPDAFKNNYKFIADNFKAAVIGTTGWNDIKDDVIAYFKKQGTPMIYASNFSIGVNVLFKVTSYMGTLLKNFPQYEPYILEMHHKFKLDAPSGTAKTISGIVEESNGKKPETESIRCGHIPGIHTICFESEVDRIKLTHEAFSRRGFAEGAVEAAKYTEKLKQGEVIDFKELFK